MSKESYGDGEYMTLHLSWSYIFKSTQNVLYPNHDLFGYTEVRKNWN
jgi:hypothetical protein